MRTACNSQATIQIYNADIARDFGTRGIFSINSGFTPVIRRGVVTVNLRAGAAVGDGALAFVIDDGLVTVDLDTHGLRIGDGHGALVIHRRAVAGDINTVTAAADIQIAVLNHLPVIASNFRTGGILAVNGGFAVVVYCGIITRNNKLTVVIILPLRCAICAHPFKGNSVIRFINLPKINRCLTTIAILQRNSPVSILGISKN
ncbi:hypothetical protein CG703_12100 [Escherichia coli]|nr:hypothetical protein CG703_12100 [Escherichia coli]